MPLLQLKNLTVRFGGLTAVGGVDCQVEADQIFSVIGPNGAGKTTVFNAITGIYEPTAGAVEFAGKEIRRPLTWKVFVACALIGLATGLAAGLIVLDFNGLWNAMVKRNFAMGEPFALSHVGQSFREYWRGELAVDQVRDNRWSVVTADGRRSVGHTKRGPEAAELRSAMSEIMALDGSDRTLEKRGEQWAILSPQDQRILKVYSSQIAARADLQKLAGIAASSAARRRNATLALLLAGAMGASGAFAVWNRARRTPDVITRAGIARTFQNIRLFQNMTVVENVMTAMDSLSRKGLLRMALRTRSLRAEEMASYRRAAELLEFVSLGPQSHILAKNLPYGGQRRLEIARALATEPKLILLDEPAAGMNPSESVDLTKLIEKIRRRGIAVLLIEHHMRVVMGISDRIAVLDYGVKIAEGSPAEIRSNPEVIKAYLGDDVAT